MIDFSVPLQTEAISALTLASKPYATMEDLNAPEVHLVEVRGTTPVEFVKAHLPKAQVTLVDNYPDAVKSLFQGRGDAIVDVVDYIGQYAKTYPAPSKVITDKNAEVDYDCIGIARGNDALRMWVNTALFQLQTTGFVATTYKKWFGIDMVYPVPFSPYF